MEEVKEALERIQEETERSRKLQNDIYKNMNKLKDRINTILIDDKR